MVSVPPKIDPRTSKDIVDQILGDPTRVLTGLRDFYTPAWTSLDPDDPGVALTMLFGRLMETVLERLNRVPEKHFITFLDLLGIDRLPGNAARTPVRFSLRKGSKNGGFVPAGTQVATGMMPSGKAHVFETETGFDVTPVVIKKAFSILPKDDLYADISSLVENEDPNQSIPLVHGDTVSEHSLYLAHGMLAQTNLPKDPGLTTLSVHLQVETDYPFTQTDLGTMGWEVAWQYRSVDNKGVETWEPLTPIAPTGNEFLGSQLMRSEIVRFKFPGTISSLQGKSEHGGGLANWIRATLSKPLTSEVTRAFSNAPVSAPSLPKLRDIGVVVRIDRSSTDVSIDAAFFNDTLLDLSKEFLPFGEQPKRADTFYLASKEAFSKPGAIITLTITLASGITVTPSTGSNPPALELEWEYWNGTKWIDLGETDSSSSFSTNSGTIVFTVPDQIMSIELNGTESYWIRVRIVQGTYGKPARYVPKPSTSPIEYLFEPADYKPPILTKLQLRYSVSIPSAGVSSPQNCFTVNGFDFRKQVLPFTPPVSPFGPIPGQEEPSLYVGFEQPFGDKQVSSFFHVVENIVEDESTGDNLPRVVWEYSREGTSWERLEVKDDTNQLTTAGTISFLGPADFGTQEQFGQRLHWLRSRFQSGVMPSHRLLKGIFLNTVWTSNLITTHDEVLGSGNSRAGQSVTFSKKPVLEDEQIYVHEREMPSQEILERMESAEEVRLGRKLTNVERESFVRTVTNNLTRETEIWVRWQRVKNFLNSGPQSRHYVLDAISGSATFGDAIHGMIPPVGRDNIKAVYYRSGGGISASKEATAQTVKVLKSSIPFVDRVMNIIDAGGGSDPESITDVLERGPQTIKNRNRAVTNEDYVWLAKQASTLVYQAKCLPTTKPAADNQLQFEAGAVTLLLVPDTDAPQPRPEQELIRKVREYIVARCVSTIRPQIFIIPPFYRQIRVHAVVKATNPEESSEVEGRIVNRLKSFLHPVKGGPRSRGWEFGRNVFISEVFQLIEETEGVDVVLSGDLREAANPIPLEEIEIGDNELPVSDDHEIVMTTG